MKTKIYLLLTAILLLAVSCQKDSVSLRFDISDFDGGNSKIMVSNRYVSWSNGDSVMINGQALPVRGGSVEDVEVSDNGYRVVFPASIVAGVASITNVSVTLPRVHSITSWPQEIQTPMCGYSATASGTIFMHNAGSLLAVTLTNYTDYGDLWLDSLVVKSSSALLSGQGVIADISSATPQVNLFAGSREVSLRLLSYQLEEDGDNLVVYIPVPAFSNSKLAIELYAKLPDNSQKKFAIVQRGNATLLRNQIAAVNFELGEDNEVTEGGGGVSVGALPGLFSVAANRQVRFSQGNLQYQASTNTWRFAENQYDVIGSANSNISSSYSGWIDLFGWGTSGYDNKYPYMTSQTSSDYDFVTSYISGTNRIQCHLQRWQPGRFVAHIDQERVVLLV